MQLAKNNSFNEVLEKNKRLLVFLFFASYLIVGLSIYKDYGLSWDENYQWKGNGYNNYNFIVHNNKEALLKSADKYHGPAFELGLVFIEKCFRLTDSRDVFFMRHFVTFLTFFISSIFFFLLSKRIFKNWRLALIGALFYILSPHIFAHSFYNSKDPVFLAFFTISIYALHVFHEKPTYLRALLFALITSITIDIRIIGILIPAISIMLVLIEFIVNLVYKIKSKTRIGIFLFYLFLVIPFVILFWPVLWLGPTHQFAEALKENSYFPWDMPVVYFGKMYQASTLPWHYVLFWIFISKPILYSAFFIIGTVVLLKQMITKPLLFLKEKQSEKTVLVWFFLPLFAIIFMKSIVFDTGRHLYFMHGAFILIALFGLQATYKLIAEKKELIYLVNAVLLFSFSSVVYRMIKIHPYQNLYFNSVAGSDMNETKKNFEFDYWGTSSREVLENILKKDSSKKIKLFVENYPAELNAKILPEEERSRIVYTDTEEVADYFITNYRWPIEGEYLYHKETYSAMIGNAKMATAFKIRPKEELYSKVKGKNIGSFSTDFETAKEGWSNNAIDKPFKGSHSGLCCDKVDSLIEYSDGLKITNVDYLYNKGNIILKTSFWKYETGILSDAKFVVAIDSSNGKPYFWHALNHIQTKQNVPKGVWEEVIGAVELPRIRAKTDRISIYLWNIGKKPILIDDIKIDFIQEEN
jgi:hypothetical protein